MLPSAMMKVPATSNSTKQLFDTIAKALAVRGAVSGAMFGMPTLKAGPKAFAGIFGDSLVFKLSGQAHADACKLKGAKAFDPSGMGRPMKEWVVVPATHAKLWPALAEDAFAFVGSAQSNPPSTKTVKKPAAKKRAGRHDKRSM
jgi:hypothetical protein